jgi:hypothetical protein
MGRYINTALGQRWTDEPLPDHAHYSPAHKQGREEGFAQGMAKMGGGGSNAPAFPTTSDIEEVGKLLVEGRLRLPKYAKVRIPTKPATHSNRKPATDSDLKPAGVPI